jgi:hypothetical protein
MDRPDGDPYEHAVASGSVDVLGQGPKLVGPYPTELHTAVDGKPRLLPRMDGESQNGSDLSSRTHLRYNQNHHRNADGRWYTASTPHDDLRVYCGHRAESFNWAKYYIVGGMYDYGFREVTYSYFGNTRLLWQCDGTADRSDGQIAWIRIG